MAGNRTGKNMCQYPKIKTHGLCGKTCDAHYCSIHIKNERKNLPLPSKCENCSIYMRVKKPTTVCKHCAVPYEEYTVNYKNCYDPFSALEKLENYVISRNDTEIKFSLISECEDSLDPIYAQYNLYLHIRTQERLHIQAVTLNIFNSVEPDFEDHMVIPKYTNLP